MQTLYIRTLMSKSLSKCLSSDKRLSITISDLTSTTQILLVLKMEEFRLGAASIAMILMVAAILFLGPLAIQGPLRPPPMYIFIVFPLILVVILLCLSRASK
ncbi:hypothetical protein ACOSQ2_016140 [Xanthoceras sorbifolium]